MLKPFTLTMPHRRRLLNHVAISMEGFKLDEVYLKRYKLSEGQLYAKKGQILQQIAQAQVELNIPIVSVFLLSEKKLGTLFPLQAKQFFRVIGRLDVDFMHRNQVKVSLIGKWYELPSETVDIAKMLIEETKDFDRFFLNLCVCYDGQSEIVDACRLIAMRVEKQRLTCEEISKETIANNLYSSNFLPPDLMILNDAPTLAGFLLWDSADSEVWLTRRPWVEFNSEALKQIVKGWLKG